jgi:hypothetical protein
MITPVDETKYTITSNFGVVRSGGKAHTGVDFAVPSGSNVRNLLDGVVTNASYKGTYGNMIEVKSSDGTIQRFAHLSSFNVKVGDKVTVGTLLAKSGNTGNSTGSHLHYEVLQGGKNVNPLNYNFSDKSTWGITEDLNNSSITENETVNEFISVLFKIVVYIVLIIASIVSLIFVFMDSKKVIKNGINAGVKGGLAYATGGASLLVT